MAKLIADKSRFRTGELDSSILSSSFGLPIEMLQVAVHRLQAVVLTLGGLAILMLVLEIVGPAAFGWKSECARAGMLVSGTLIPLSVLFLILLRFSRLKPETLLHIGLVYQILVCFALSYAELQHPSHLEREFAGISVICVFLVLFPMFIPTCWMRGLVTGILSASTGPLAAYVYYSLVGLEVPGSSIWAAYVPNYVTVGLVAVPLAMVQQMGRELTKARKLGSYELKELLGKGAMGEVWHASHDMLRRPAAIKLIAPEALKVDSPREVDTLMSRFEREAQATAELHSPHSIQLYDFGTTETGTFYYVMEMLEGLNLDELVSRYGPLPAERVVHLLLQTCDSLWDAHQSRLIHRDVKPANIFVCRYGHKYDYVKVLDFGLVKYHGNGTKSEIKLTQADMVTGTPAFLPPEVAKGVPTDARADIYSLGCVGYWLLTGSLVFEKESAMQVAIAHVQEQPIPPSERSELEVPADLEKVIMSCLEKDPAKRPQTTEELTRALSACQCAPAWSDDKASKWWQTYKPLAANA